jgi:S1-C subfamily serine protease
MRIGVGIMMAFIGAVMGAVLTVAALQVLDDDDGSSDSTTATAETPASTDEGDDSSELALSTDCQTAAEIYEAVRPSVVEVTTVVNGVGAFGQDGQGSGSGVAIDDAGYILTNNHVVEGATSIEVRFSDDSTATATLVGSDPANDLALLQVDPATEALVAASLADSDELSVGDPVVAIGNPFNLEGTLTQGIVSALGRTYSSGATTRPIYNMIQTDTAVNPGNSGGPLINCRGQVIGINTLLENPTGQGVNVGVAFAVAINTATAAIEEMKAGETVSHPWLGIAGTDVTPARATELDLSVETGVYVTLVSPNSPAEEAGLQGAFSSEEEAASTDEVAQGGDVIVEVDGQAVGSIEELAGYLDQNKRPGDSVELVVSRDGETVTLTATLADWPG